MANNPFTQHTGIAAPLLENNIDTDQIIPSREMTSVSKTGLTDGLFAGQRYIESRTPNPDFILNQPEYAGATILLSGQNFGCGSSREHAVWALKEYGFRAVIAESFGEIFYMNCIRNGILPISLSADAIKELPREITIDLEAQRIGAISFEINQADKKMLLKGLDSIALTLKHKGDIEAFLVADKKQRPWIYS